MSNKDDNLIAQIRDKEKEVAEMLERVKKENDQQITEANESAKKLISETEDGIKEVGYKRLLEGKEKGKEEYKRILVEEDNKRRDETEGGKANLPKAKKYIHNSFIKIFN